MSNANVWAMIRGASAQIGRRRKGAAAAPAPAFDPTSIDWAAFWIADNAVDTGAGLASSMPNDAAGASDAGTNADFTFDSTLRPAISSIAAANSQTGLVFVDDSVGYTAAVSWWGLSTTSDKTVWIVVMLIPSTHSGAADPVLQARRYSVEGGGTLRPRNIISSLVQAEQDGGATNISLTPTAANVPVPNSVPFVAVFEYDGGGGTATLKMVSQGISDAGSSAVLGVFTATSAKEMILGGTGTAVPAFDGTFFQAGVLKTWLTFTEDVNYRKYLETKYGITGLYMIHRKADMHLSFRVTDISSEIDAWDHLVTGAFSFTANAAADRPATSTLNGLTAPHFRGNTETNYLTTSDLIGDLVNTGDGHFHFFIVFQSNNQAVSPTGTAYYQIPCFILGVDGWFGVGMLDDGSIVAGFNDGASDYNLTSASGYDDNGVHVIHVAFDGDAFDFSLQVDGDTPVTTTTSAVPRAMTDVMRVGAEYGVASIIEATYHLFSFRGAMTAGQVTDFYSFLNIEYGVTTP